SGTNTWESVAEIEVKGTAKVVDASGKDVTAQFDVSVVPGSLTIDKRDVVVAANDSSKTFGASDPDFAATVTGEVEGEEGIIEYTVSRPDADVDEAVGTYPDAIVAAGEADQGNYKVTYEPADSTITEQSITPGPDPDNPDPSYANVVVSEPDDATYNGQHQQSPVTVTRVDGEGNVIATLLEKVDYTLTYANDVNAGVETATVTVKGIGNYKGEVIKHYTISPAAALITVDDSSKIYGANDPAFTGAVKLADGNPLYTNALTGVVDTIGDVTYSRTNSDEDAGSYPGVLTATVANANGNYTYTVEPGNFTISRAGDNDVTIETAAEDRSKTYDGQPITIDVTATESGSTLWYSTDGENWTETKPSLTNVGSLTIYVKATNPNFEDSAVVNATVQVTPRPVTITTGSAAKIFDGNTLTAEGYEITSGSFVEGETYGVDFGDSGQTAAGQSDNDATVVFAGEGNEYTAQSGNYSVTVVPGKLTVYPQSIDPNDPDPDNPDPEDPDPTDPDPENPDQPFYNGVKVAAPNDVTYNGLSQQQAPIVTDREGNALDPNYYDVTYSEDTVNVGIVTITVSGKNGYTGSVEVTYNILKAPLTISTPSAGKVYDGTPLQNQQVSAGVWQDNDGSQVTLTATGSITEVGSVVNGYTVSDPEGVLANYEIAEDLGVLTVWPQSIDPNDPGEDPDPDDPDAPDPSIPDPDFPGEDPDPDNPVVPDQPFYTGAVVDSPVDVAYNGADQTWVPTVTDAEGKVLTEGTDYTVSYSTEDRTNVTGTITVTITGMGDYAGTVTRTYQITPVRVAVNTQSASKVYDGTPLTAPGEIVTLVNGETATVNTSSITEVGSIANDYEIVWNGTAKQSNYTVVSGTIGTLTITAAPVPPTPDTPTPDTPTPTPLPTPDPTPTPGTTTPVPTPGPGDGDATPADPTDEAEATIDDEATPLTAPEPIDDDATPLASGAHRDCWVHWLMLLGILVTVVYYGGVGVRRVRFSSSLQSFEDDVLGNDETNR
ncbi:MAG: MBG domain-containing protein, partial [Eggerthellaceae bacterium]